MTNRTEVSEIEEADGSTLIILQEGDCYAAERTAPGNDGPMVTRPQENMTAEECIRYLSHLLNGANYIAAKQAKDQA